MPQRRADALVDVFEHFNKHHGGGDGTARHRPHIEIVLEVAPDGSEQYSNGDGRPVKPSNAHAWMCDATWQRVVRHGNHVIDYGKAARTLPYPAWRAIALRDRGCRFPGCTRPIRFCDAHHIAHVGADDGLTDYENGVMLCNRHHHLVHKDRWQLKLLDDAHIEFRRPGSDRSETTRPHRRP